MTNEVKQNIEQQFKTQVTSATIFINFRLSDNNLKIFFFKSKNIYNAKTIIRKRALNLLTSILAFMKFLNQAKYYLHIKKVKQIN